MSTVQDEPAKRFAHSLRTTRLAFSGAVVGAALFGLLPDMDILFHELVLPSIGAVVGFIIVAFMQQTKVI